MIKANDLMMGNWVYNTVEKRNKEITQLWKDVEFTELNPIHLTPEILTEWCGFKKIDPAYDIWSDSNIGLYFTNGYFSIDRSKKYQYVHELQNLYFAYVGNELEIKIPSTSHTY